jgi:hypothetical protein
MSEGQFAFIAVMLAMLNVTGVFVCLWLRRVYNRLNRLPQRVAYTSHDGAVTIYEND